MANQIKVEICKKCKGKGIISYTGKPCDQCKGIGLYGTDGTKDYYLAYDKSGNLRIDDIKTTVPLEQESKPKKPLPALRSNTRKLLLFLLLLISYSGFIGLYIVWIKSPKVFWVVTIITAGFFFVFIVLDPRLIGAITKFVTGLVFKEHDDFLSAVEKRRKKV